MAALIFSTIHTNRRPYIPYIKDKHMYLPTGVQWRDGTKARRKKAMLTFTKASRTSKACSMLRGVDTVSPRVMMVRLVRQFIKSLESTCLLKNKNLQQSKKKNQVNQFIIK